MNWVQGSSRSGFQKQKWTQDVWKQISNVALHFYFLINSLELSRFNLAELTLCFSGDFLGRSFNVETVPAAQKCHVFYALVSLFLQCHRKAPWHHLATRSPHPTTANLHPLGFLELLILDIEIPCGNCIACSSKPCWHTNWGVTDHRNPLQQVCQTPCVILGHEEFRDEQFWSSRALSLDWIFYSSNSFQWFKKMSTCCDKVHAEPSLHVFPMSVEVELSSRTIVLKF